MSFSKRAKFCAVAENLYPCIVGEPYYAYTIVPCVRPGGGHKPDAQEEFNITNLMAVTQDLNTDNIWFCFLRTHTMEISGKAFATTAVAHYPLLRGLNNARRCGPPRPTLNISLSRFNPHNKKFVRLFYPLNFRVENVESEFTLFIQLHHIFVDGDMPILGHISAGKDYLYYKRTVIIV